MEIAVRDRVYGVDFSGAKDAGKRIWIASGAPVKGTLQIQSCRPAENLPGSSGERDHSLWALRRLIIAETRAAFGLDFPFGLPEALVAHEHWESFVLAFPQDYPSPKAFRERCCKAAQGKELRRLTDGVAQTPFSPYNIRLYRQTFYGIRDLLHPLVEKGQARVLPMQEPAEDRPWLLEICPASTLKRKGLYMPYKGNRDRHRSARRQILGALERSRIAIEEPALRSTIVQDSGGDALDSVIAALATFEALSSAQPPVLEDHRTYALEGYVYVTNADQQRSMWNST
jgi:hypothetical protein